MSIIEAWETEDAALVVIGTHDPSEAYPVAKKFYEDVSEVPDALEEALKEDAVPYWVNPEVVEDEQWPESHVSSVQVGDWTPFMVVNW